MSCFVSLVFIYLFFHLSILKCLFQDKSVFKIFVMRYKWIVAIDIMLEQSLSAVSSFYEWREIVHPCSLWAKLFILLNCQQLFRSWVLLSRTKKIRSSEICSFVNLLFFCVVKKATLCTVVFDENSRSKRVFNVYTSLLDDHKLLWIR